MAAHTELVFILDRSGSMSGLEQDTIGGFNSNLERMRSEEGEVTVTTVLFDHQYELLHDRLDLAAVRPLTRADYWVRGSTALLDALGRSIMKIKQVQRSVAKEHRAAKVMFVIITDGMENASSKFSAADIKKMVTKAQDKKHWDFIFIGANMDAIAAASSYGISREMAAPYIADAKGSATAYDAVAKVVSAARAGGPLPPAWAAHLEADVAARSPNQ
jgi:uncharacterized protein YegL